MGVLEPGKYMCSTLHPTVMAKINGIDDRIMMDSGASSSYICTELLTKLRMRPTRYQKKIIEQMYGTVQKKVERYNVKLTSSAFSNFAINVDCISAGKDVLTYIVNPNIHHLKKKHPRLSHLRFSEENAVGEVLPVHVILGVADYQRIKTMEPPVLGKNTDKDPGVELTMLGWMIQGGFITHTSDLERTFFLNSGVEEFNKLCSLEVLGVADEAPSKENELLSKFTDNLHITESGRYTTRLPWKTDCVELPTNKDVAVARLHSTTRKLEKLERLSEYDNIMKDQIQLGTIEEVKTESSASVTHYIPHHAVIREEAESTKMRIVYDCSAKAD
ncbi:hypothetical protein QZH41_005978 [Actinostola sp. cb2023]|nr:hypothetical protein QZH41_005978 [Actinostola sp. cb2023]